MIHKSAIVSKKAKIGNNVKIGPFSIIGDKAVIGDNVEIKSHVVIEGRVTIGEGTIIYPFASLCYPQTLKYQGEDSEIIIGNYILLAVAPGEKGATLKPFEEHANKKIEDKFVGFWRIPSDAPYYGLKPSGLGDNLQMMSYPES